MSKTTIHKLRSTPATIQESSKCHKGSGFEVALATGCFDIIHAGHIEMLEFAGHFGTLFVGLNSDAAIARLKGSTRPLNSIKDRMRVVGALSCVSYVFEIPEDTVTSAIALVEPNYWIKGSDWTLETLNKDEVAMAKEMGSTIVFAPKLEGYSSTKIIERMRT